MKKLTVKDIAKEVGVSTATISRVLNNSGYVSEQVREQVLQTVEKLNYQPNSIARSLKQKKSRSVGIVLPDMTNPYFMSIARQIRRKLLTAGYHLLFMDSEEDPVKEKEALDFLMEKRVEALVVAGTGANKEKLEAVHASGIHVVLIDRMIKGLKVDVVAEDSRTVSEEAVAYLLEKGHRHIGIISGPRDVVTARDRYEGAVAAFDKLGVAVDPRYVYEGDFSRRSGMEAIKYLMQQSPCPTAIFSANNEMSYGLYLGLHELGVRTDHIEVLSFGDLEFSPLFQNKLSVIKQNPEQIGDAAGELVLKRLEQSVKEYETRMFTPQLVPKI
ncbi:LacI family DNA-binding transcriptional regulator [Paenibacillus thermotolerans]|uniref:LacI family DNA-binding transcriptional regulator n=1 Tax=Paenibacillus thermotolerans TaxID=3027807 RepID=UPI00236864EA|nr:MULTISPECIES: LacI family DNA-binding transcriptional regulator [unclassified Paenibacillus]